VTALRITSKALPGGFSRVCSGQCAVPGYDLRSYRAEGYNMIGGLLFLRHLCLFSNRLNIIPLHSIYCDNQGLIKKVNKLFTFRLASTASALHSEYDVLITNKSLLTGFQSLPAISHVHEHQDNDIDYADLPLPAQLNVDADVLATEELAERPTTCTLVPLMPAAKVQFSISGHTITRKLSALIRRQYGLLLIKCYLKDRFRPNPYAGTPSTGTVPVMPNYVTNC
jgi:hypothetical protein